MLLDFEPINRFTSNFRFLSNFYISPFILDGKEWRSVEHYFQAMKTVDIKVRERIRLVLEPKDAKKLGRKVDLRQNWDTIRVIIMMKAVKAKFTQNESLKKLLLETGDRHLVEGNWWHDNIWGDCYCDKCKDIQGLNLLGKILMKIRESLKNEEKN